MSYLGCQHKARADLAADHATACIGLTADTRVLTLAGAVRVEDLQPGDHLITRSGARSLCGLHILPRHDAATILIATGALGAGQPSQNIRLRPDQQILFPACSSRAADATRPAFRTAAATGTGSAPITDQRLYLLELADPAVIYADGLQLACCAKAT